MLRIDANQIKPGDTFLALQNENYDGHEYINQAIDNGAACIIASKGDYDVKTIIVEDTKTYLSNYLKELNFDKMNKIKLIGIVGTSGKTSVGNIIYQLSNKLNKKTAYIGSDAFHLNDKKTILEEKPNIYQIYEFINQAIDNECQNIIIELSSNDTIQRNFEGLRFDIAIFTNYNENKVKEDQKQIYLNSKIEPFKMIKPNGHAIINKDDKYSSSFALVQNHNIFYGKSPCEYQIHNIKLDYEKTTYNINDKKVDIPLINSYNVYNFTAAFITLQKLACFDEDILEAALTLKPINSKYQPIRYKNNLVILDSADNLEKIASIIKITKEFSQGKIIAVLDIQNKQKNLSTYLIKNLNYVFFTTDNNIYENTQNEKLNELETNNSTFILSRKEALKKSLSQLEEKDILLILDVKNKKSTNDIISFDDYDELTKLVRK